MAYGQWIFSIDADERLLQHQYEKLRGLLVNADEKVGAYLVRNISVDLSVKDPKGYYLGYNEACTRIFRNLPEFQYVDAIHESIDASVVKHGYLLKQTTIKVDHLGYEEGVDKMDPKLVRNILAYWNHPELSETYGASIKEKCSMRI